MNEGAVAERSFLHLSNWTDPVDSPTVDTAKAWKGSQYWTYRLSTNEWRTAGQLADGSLRLGNVVFQKDHALVELIKRFKYASEHAKELVFENVRRKEFPNRTSRRSCMFVFDEQHDVDAYAAGMWKTVGSRALYPRRDRQRARAPRPDDRAELQH